MELVIDANIVVSALISDEGKARELIFLPNFSLFAPEYLLEEIEKYKGLIIKKSGLDEKSFEAAKSLIFSRIKFISVSEFKSFIDKASEICPDENDEEYFALALKLNCLLWSNDKKLKQGSLKVLTTSEVLGLF